MKCTSHSNRQTMHTEFKVNYKDIGFKIFSSEIKHCVFVARLLTNKQITIYYIQFRIQKINNLIQKRKHFFQYFIAFICCLLLIEEGLIMSEAADIKGNAFNKGTFMELKV